ncbi:MAG: hypothetical protein R3A52_07375 [Polyangiales bacterium]
MPRRALTALAIASLAAATARAQDAPPPPPPAEPPPAELPPPPAGVEVLRREADPSRAPAPDAHRAAIDAAVGALAQGRPSAALATLSAFCVRLGLDLRGYDTAAVLLRVAVARERPGTPTAGQHPTSTSSVPADPSLPPPPPDDAEAGRNVVDAAAARVAAGDAASAVAWIDAALAAETVSPYSPLGALRRAAVPGGVSAAQPDELVASSMGAYPRDPRFSRAYEIPRAAVAPSTRPPGTIEGFEAFTLYGVAVSYGFVLGTWGGLVATNDDRNATRLILPIAGLGAGVVAAALIDSRRTLRRGRAYAANSGFWLGSLAGVGVALAADLKLDDDGDNGAMHAITAGATLGIAAGVGLAHATDALPGAAGFTLSCGAWGALTGLMVSFIGADDRRGRDQQSISGIGLLVGEVLGAGFAIASAHALRPTPAQARIMDAGAALGFIGGMITALPGAISSDTPDALFVGAALGTVGGGILGYVLGAPSDFTRDDYLRRNAANGVHLRAGVMPVQGGAVATLSL